MDPLRYEVERWRAYSEMLGFAKLEHAERDYLQELLLFGIYTGRGGQKLVFRGGTAISKFYGSGRFSEDIDFILADGAEKVPEPLIEAAIRSMDIRYRTEYSKKEYRNMIRFDLKVKGPIYMVAGNEQAKQTIKIDLNTFERPLLAPQEATRIPVYGDIGPYSAVVADNKELLADKIKALLERSSPVARDLYDAWLLIRKYKLNLDVGLVRKKMQEYGKREGESFSLTALKEKTKRIQGIWETELSRLMRTVPDYKTVRKEFYQSF